MDKMCNKSELGNVNGPESSVGEGSVNPKRCESPVFKCVNHNKSVRGGRSDSSDCDYQFSQTIKSRTSSKYEHETSDSVLLFSPVLTPIPKCSVQFQLPSLHSLGTVSKGANGDNNSKELKPCSVFESLGMTDKDISWVSSMATPPQLQVPSNGFNTIEKATFLPEENFQNIQPRALFSPTLDEDFGCKPLRFSSDSENDESYQTNIRLSDVCATLKQLEVKSLDQKTPEKKILSPVIKSTKKKGSCKKKPKGILVISPELNDKYEFSVNDELKSEKVASNFIEDDSFQSISFTCIDELCKTLVSLTDPSSVLESTKCDDTLVPVSENKLGNSASNYFYNCKTKSDVCAVSSMENLHPFTQALEEGDVSVGQSKKIEKTLVDAGIVRFDALEKDSNATKRLHSEVMDEEEESVEKKLKMSDEAWDAMKKYLTESQLNVSDSEMFKTVENVEKTLVSQDSKGGSPGDTIGAGQEKNSSGVASGAAVEDKPSTSSQCFLGGSLSVKPGFVGFLTASGSKVSISEEALIKAKQVFKSCDEDDGTAFTCTEGFSTGAGQRVHISREALEKAKALMCEENSARCWRPATRKTIKVSPEALEKAKVLMSSEKPSEGGSKWMKGFLTGSGKTIKVSSQALEKAKSLLSECTANSEGTSKTSPDLGKKIPISPEALEKAKALMSSEGPSEVESKWMKGFLTGSGKTIKVSSEAYEKAKSLLSECAESSEGTSRMSRESPGTKIPISPEALEKAKVLMSNEEPSGKKLMKGFLTGSGKTIQVSSQALEKAKSLLSDCTESSEGTSKMSTELDKKIPISLEALDKAKALMSNEEQSGKKWMKGFLTGSGKTIKVSSQALEKAKSLLSDCGDPSAADVKRLNHDSNKTVQVSPEALEKTLISECDSMAKGGQDPFRNVTPGVQSCGGLKFSGFTTGLGNQVKVSIEAVEKIKAESGSLRAQITSGNAEGPVVGFSTAAGTKVTVSETALAKAQELVARWDQGQSERPKNFETSRDSKTESPKRVSGIVDKAEPAGTSEDDWEEIIPSWLHVYTTSPSLVSDGTELSPVQTREDGRSYQAGRDCIIKSPVLGSSDRFYKKIKRRKLQFKNDGSEVAEVKTCSFVAPSSGKKPSVKRISTSLTMDFSVPFKKARSSEVQWGCMDVEEERAKARARQEETAKEKEKVKPSRGSHLSRKLSEKQVKWVEAVGGASPETHPEEFLLSMGVKESVLRVNITNALEFKFSGPEYFGPSCVNNTTGFPIGDGCLLIPDESNEFGVEEFKRAFAAAPGVEPNLLPDGWLENHYKWIVWKLAHYERSFPRHFGGRGLTPHNIMLQLKYRYDREIDGTERSALRKILERDDTSVRRMVLCVCGIKKVVQETRSDYELRLTDGWYSCLARTDPAMTRLIEKGKLSVGTKLITQGAALINCDQGISPLELKEEACLRISTNSTRRVRWDAKLGFQKNPKNFSISLASVLPQGGLISRLDVIVVRVYPMLYMEKTSDGRHVTRNLRSEEKADFEYRKIQEKRVETISSEIQAEMLNSGKRRSEKKLNEKKLFEVEKAEDLCHLMESSSDPSALEELMTAKQRELVENFHLKESDRLAREISGKIEEKLRKEKLNKRNVSEFLRVKVVDWRKPDYNNPAVLSVWSPDEEVVGLFSEGRAVSLTNISLPNSSRVFKPMQINSTRHSRYREISRSIKYPARQVTRLKDVSSKICPVFEEVDVVGMIALIQDASYGSRFSQTVYLTDFDFNFVGIVFWGSCKDYGWENVLTLRSIVACSNLQWKKSCASQQIPSLSVNENSVFTENPKRMHLKEELDRLKNRLPEDLNTFATECEEALTTKLEDSKWRAALHRNSSADDSGPRPGRVSGFESKPTASSTPIKPFPANLTSGEAEPSPIQRRIEKLQSYGEPPPLLPLIVANAKKLKRKT